MAVPPRGRPPPLFAFPNTALLLLKGSQPGKSTTNMKMLLMLLLLLLLMFTPTHYQQSSRAAVFSPNPHPGLFSKRIFTHCFDTKKRAPRSEKEGNPGGGVTRLSLIAVTRHPASG